MRVQRLDLRRASTGRGRVRRGPLEAVAMRRGRAGPLGVLQAQGRPRRVPRRLQGRTGPALSVGLHGLPALRRQHLYLLRTR